MTGDIAVNNVDTNPHPHSAYIVAYLWNGMMTQTSQDAMRNDVAFSNNFVPHSPGSLHA